MPNRDEDGNQAVTINWAVYSDGRPVLTVVDWLDGYDTLVHHPDGLKTDADDGGLDEELCPCCGGMPSTGPGADDDGTSTLQRRSTRGEIQQADDETRSYLYIEDSSRVLEEYDAAKTAGIDAQPTELSIGVANGAAMGPPRPDTNETEASS